MSILIQADGFDNGKQWQSDLGGLGNWKNRPTHKNGEHSMLIDINGDGLPDRVLDANPKTHQKGLFVYLNTGNGFDNGKQWQSDLGGGEDWKNRPCLPLTCLSLVGGKDWKNRPMHRNGEYSMLIDINGDGLPDRVFDKNPKTDQKGLFAYLNTGNGFDSGKQWQSNLGGNENWKNRPTHKGGEYSMLIDINGDGLPDRVFDKNPKTDQPGFFVYSKPYKTPRLKAITNGFGIQTTLNYKPLTDSSVYTKGSKKGYHPNITIQNARQVISSVTTDNAIGGQNTTTYKYGNAKVNVKGRGNLGFGWIEKKDLQSNKLTRTEYSQTYPYAGHITATKEYIETNDIRQLLNEQINTYRNKSRYSNKVHSPYLHRSKERAYDFNASGDSPLTTITTNQSNIDNYGNVGTIRIRTTGSNNKTFSNTTKNTYSNDITNWHLGRLSKAKVTHSAANTPSITRTSSFTYNSNGLLQSETIAPNTNKSLTTTYEYDSFGNKTKSTITGSGIVSRSTTVEYSADGKFPVKTTNALGHSETKTFDAKTGNVLTLTGPNGLTTSWEYDVLGRQAKETRADSTITTTNYEWWVMDVSRQADLVYKVTTATSGSSPKITYFDGFNRKVREQHTGFDGRKIISSIYYDDLGRVKQASLPYFEDEKKYFVTTEYDAIGRLINTTKPADNGKTATSATSYNGLSTTTTNALGHQKTITKNIIGKVIRIDEPKNAWLTHHYNSVGNLIKTVVGGVTTTMEYDISGNKTKMNDPDMGTWTYSYNALGKLISQTDAKGQTSTMTYDKLGRITQRTEAEGSSTWTYDTKSNGTGKLSIVKGPNGYKKELSYDALGRVKSTTLTVNGETLTTTNTYDRYSRLNIQTRPQNFKVENVYNQYGYLMAKRAPKAQITDYDWEYLSKLLEQSTANTQKATEQANKLEIKISKYNAYSEHYKKLSTKLLKGSDLLSEDAQALRDNADLLDEISNKLEQKAQYFKSLADNASMKASIGFGSTPLVAQRNKALYSDIAERLTKQAQNYLNSQGEERQILANQIADEYDDYAEILIEHADQATQEAAHWKQVVDNTQKSRNKNHYQAMLDDTNNVYFYRIKSRDAAGRLTGHIVGNGLSTEQDFSPASGHLYTIKSNFNSVDEVRNLEYEYDLMDNVTQRQNHLSGLSERFTYDALDRLTQSSTTGKIDDVDYSYAVDYKYDINGNITNKSDVGDYSYNAASGVR
ncbi:Rhs family protein, partial [uncultured Gammaproteobacteria bacterium]